MRYLKVALFFMLCAGASGVQGQVQDQKTPGFDFGGPDTTITDSGYSEEEVQQDSSAKIDPLLRPYERIVLYIDSTTNLISYYGIIEQEESTSDSLYIRAKRWVSTYIGKDVKLEVDKRNQKLTYVGTIPAYAYMNKYSKRPIGKYEFRITFLIKEGRYKYVITNLVHESVKPSDGSKSSRNYFEYYYTSTTKVRENDTVLRNADKDINKMIDSMIAAMREPVIVDEDDW